MRKKDMKKNKRKKLWREKACERRILKEEDREIYESEILDRDKNLERKK